VRFWDVNTLTLVRELEVKSPPGCNRSRPNDANYQIHSMALSKDEQNLLSAPTAGRFTSLM
jgi:hypothetical protein